jgi:hypothetical protein
MTELREASGVEDPVVAFAKQWGWKVRKLKWIGRRAAPDRMFFRAGKIVFVEFKRAGKAPNVLQEREIKRMRDNGLTVHVIDDADVGRALFI